MMNTYSPGTTSSKAMIYTILWPVGPKGTDNHDLAEWGWHAFIDAAKSGEAVGWYRDPEVYKHSHEVIV